ncbi:CAP domain-containing protein [Luteipulveratus mongoliensis]|uniref:CAP domain-containing protein n=1 Tax=Luteipulveratus mongoliensis TaxID=571913 RepID=UPI001FE135DD|nr:CAP domain-containing protein [Luteipulveratus mongoliensis]
MTADPQLGAAAYSHAKDMVDHTYFSHTGLDGSSAQTRSEDAGFAGQGGWENIAAGQSDPAAVMDSWMKSPGHRANILNCDLNRLGVGYHPGKVDPAYGGGSWVQDFGTK